MTVTSDLDREVTPRGGFGATLAGMSKHLSHLNARGDLSFDLPVRQAQGPEALEGEALDRWFGVNPIPPRGVSNE